MRSSSDSGLGSQISDVLQETMKLIDGIPVWGTPDEGAMNQIKTCAKTADRVALMADHHKGYAVPIGGVVAYKDAIRNTENISRSWPMYSERFNPENRYN